MAPPVKRKAPENTDEGPQSKRSKAEDVFMKDVDAAEPSPKDGVSSPKELKNALYARCASEEDGKVFFQSDLLSYNIIPGNNVEKLLLYTQQLLKEGLFKLMTKDGKTCWRVVKRDDAAKYKSLTSDEALVYSYIESSGRDGMWSKLLRARTNLHMTTMNRAIKGLENRNYIKSIKTVRFPTRKTYILSWLQPSEDVTGGPFYTDGILDAEFIHQMSIWTERYIIGRSWWHPPPPQPEHHHHRSSSSSNKKKLTTPKTSKATPSVPKPEPEESEKSRAAEAPQQRSKPTTTTPGRERSKAMLPLPPDYKNYPTITEITRAINASKLTDVVMKNTEMQQLVDILCWDGRVEQIIHHHHHHGGGGGRSGSGSGREAYRAVRVIYNNNGDDDDDDDHEKGKKTNNGLTEAPCGTCPVFDLCQDDGPVNARTCRYFEDWLAF